MIKVVERKPLSRAEKSYLPQIVRGLAITGRSMLQPPVTLEYPEQPAPIPPGYRGAPTLVRDPNGRVKCVACQLCEFVCPPKAIRIMPMEIPAGAETANVEKIPEKFELDMLRCIYCGLCEEVCPEEAIFLQNVYSMCGYTRQEMVLGKEQLLNMGGTLPDRHYKWEKKRLAEERAKLNGAAARAEK